MTCSQCTRAFSFQAETEIPVAALTPFGRDLETSWNINCQTFACLGLLPMRFSSNNFAPFRSLRRAARAIQL